MYRFLIVFLSLACCNPAGIFARTKMKYRIDTVKGTDTIIERYFKKSGVVDYENYYVRDSLVYSKYWFYKKHYFGYIKTGSKSIKPRPVEYFEFHPDSHLTRYELKPGWKMKEVRTYYDSGGIESVDYYAKSRHDTGYGLVYHKNGMIWTKWLYVNGRLVNVLFNYDKNGNPMEIGDFNKGYGKLNNYDENGNLVEYLYFKRGKFKKVKKIKK